MKLKLVSLALGAALAIAAPAHAQGWYVSGSAGFNFQADSDNSGQTTSAFNTGNGAPVIPNATPIAAGTSLGWTTELDNGYAIAGEVGLYYDGGLRSGIEVVYSEADVDTHRNVAVGGTVIDGVDAAVLTGSATQLGATVGDVVAGADEGGIENTSVFANLYYDFARDAQISPYIGAGIGFSDVNVKYAPSGVPIVDDGETKFAYQIKGGATWKLNDQFEIFGEAAYRATEDVEVDVQLVPARLDIENQQTVLSLGVRYCFGA
jgi:opacity protein-like surface antigen